MSDMNLPDAIFFDWDGTLVDSFAFLQSAHDHVLGFLGLEPRAPGWFHYYFGKPREFIYHDIYGAMAGQAQASFEAFVQKNHTKMVVAASGAGDLLQMLHENGVKMGVVTNKKGDFVRGETKALGWDQYFSAIVAAGETEEDKPSCAPLRFAVKEAGCAPDHAVWFVGDTEADLLCAKKFDCPVIFMHPNPQEFEWLGEYTPFHITSDCNSLREFLLQYRQKSLKQSQISP